MEDNPHLVGEYTSRYINVVNNYLNFFYLQKAFNPFAHYIARLEAVKPRSDNLKVKLFETIYSLKLMECLGQRELP